MEIFFYIVSTIILTLITNWISKPVLKYLTNSATGFRNKLYKRASTRQYDQISGRNSFVIGLILVFGLLVTQQVSFEKKIENLNKAYEIEVQLEKENFDTNIMDNMETKNLLKLLWLFNYIVLGLIYIVVVSLIWNFSYNQLINDTISKFDQKLKTFTPYLSTKEFSLIESKWALMRTYEDYQLINTELKKIGSESDLPIENW